MFLSVGSNKEALLSFIASIWKTCSYTLFDDVEVFITDAEKCFRLSKNGNRVSSWLVSELASHQVEAHTRMVLHVKHACRFSKGVLIRTPDTDVILLCVAISRHLSIEVFVEAGVRDHYRIIDIEAMKKQLTLDLQNAVIGFHSFTGTEETTVNTEKLFKANFNLNTALSLYGVYSIFR